MQPEGVYGAGFINPDGAFAGTGTITVVPEPTTVAMMVLGEACSSACSGSAASCAKTRENYF